MSVGVLLVTHDGLGETLLDTARYVLGDLPRGVQALPVDSDRVSESLDAEARASVEALNEGAGVIVLTDLIGATPGNVCRRLSDLPQVAVVYGVNLPMLVKTLNYRHLTLEELVAKALQGGRDGILSQADSN